MSNQNPHSYLKNWKRRTLFLVENLNLQKASGVDDAIWEDFQIAELNNDSMFGIERKCRQVGWSFLIALRGVTDAILDGRSSVFSSINQREAQDKIRYAQAIYNNLELSGLPKFKISNRSELEFDNGARLISTAAGRGIPNSNFFVDEWAWKKNAREIYTASVPVISKGGCFRGGSSTNGASGIFWEIDTEVMRKYPDFVRTATKWWDVRAFCENVPLARRQAPQMPTAERVEKFAKPRLKMIFENTVLEDFQQEYEAIYVDETTAWITWAEIQNATQADDYLCFLATAKNDDLELVLETIENFIEAIKAERVEQVFFGGVDIGRVKNTTEIYLVARTATKHYPLRLTITLDNCDFDTQIAVIDKILRDCNIALLKIDKSGLGRQIAEHFEKLYPSKVIGVIFTNELKQLWATNLKMNFQKGLVLIPIDRDLAYQLHSIKKTVTASKNLVFDTEKAEKHHADKFWSLALAVDSAKSDFDIEKIDVSSGVERKNLDFSFGVESESYLDF